jgi:hypothetical protein
LKPRYIFSRPCCSGSYTASTPNFVVSSSLDLAGGMHESFSTALHFSNLQSVCQSFTSLFCQGKHSACNHYFAVVLFCFPLNMKVYAEMPSCCGLVYHMNGLSSFGCYGVVRLRICIYFRHIVNQNCIGMAWLILPLFQTTLTYLQHKTRLIRYNMKYI